MERIHVTVRARPLSPEDTKMSPWRISGSSVFIPGNHSAKFEFDRVFGEECKTAEVYHARTEQIVAAAVRGFNGTVFAYGQTNSGKTHTMRGYSTEPGVIPLAVHDLFDIIQEDTDREFLLRMSYMEIYNEDINDLLVPEHRKLQIHESLERGIYVAGLREEIVASPQQVLDLMQFGESHRHIGETNMNLYSSRSHTIFRMIIESRDRTEDADGGGSCDAVRVSVLNLVDLAGSERAAKTGAEGVRLKEGSHINKSLMTLGTVIKKLSEGAESQGGHVPYRDSKLTRILQPSLGGNANTAIICNITLAQVHADETKSSLQFASRALRVTNCAHVNEILTDAALLKRQKKEIEELRAKLQGSHSEHLEEEILSLRNTLLQSELERERIILELEEEKRAQAEREKVLQEQAKKIKNLSSMVLYSNWDENRDHYKKVKRRDTWCPGNLSREILQEADHNVQSRISEVKPIKASRDVGPLLAFEELERETEVGDNFCRQNEGDNDGASESCTLPDPCALLCVTNRRKEAPRKKISTVEDHKLVGIQEDEELVPIFENKRIISELQTDSSKEPAENDLWQSVNYNGCSSSHENYVTGYLDRNVSSRESEAIIVIKQLQEKVKMLELEKSSSQQKLDSVVELATEKNLCAREKFLELQEELQIAREEARIAHEQLASVEYAARTDVTVDCTVKLPDSVEDIVSEVQYITEVTQNLSSFLDEVFNSLPSIFNVFNELKELKSLMQQSSLEYKSLVSNHQKLHSCLRLKIAELENDKADLHNQSVELKQQIDQLTFSGQNHEDSLRALSDLKDAEKMEFISQIQNLEKELSSLSSSFLAKEKENLRKDLEKTKTKLKETEFKLKNAVQEKTRIEGEKAFAEKEIRRLNGQKSLLDRDINKRDSLAGRRRDQFVEAMQEDYKGLEVLAFEMEATIASLEEEVANAQTEKEEAMCRSERLASELEALTENLNLSNSELSKLQEEFPSLRQRLEDSESDRKKLENSIKELLEEKEELAMQLTNSLLEIEEEKAIWHAKERVTSASIQEKEKLHNAKVTSMSSTTSEMRRELDECMTECNALQERLALCEKNAHLEKECREEKSLEIDKLNHELKRVNADIKHLQEDKASYQKEKAKLRMRLRGTQAKLEAYRFRYKEAVDEIEFMDKKFKEGSRQLKDMLASKGIEVLKLRKQFASCRCNLIN